MKKNYRSILPSGDSQKRESDNVRHSNNNEDSHQMASLPKRDLHKTFLDEKEFSRRVKVVIAGKLFLDLVRETITMLEEQVKELEQLPLDCMRNNANKIANQDISISPLEEMNDKAEQSLRTVARKIHKSNLMIRYIEELTRAERERWQLSETDKEMIKGSDKACEYIEEKVEIHLSRMASRMEWFPAIYHIVDKLSLIVLPVLGYYTGKHQLDDSLLFLWVIAVMPILAITVVWAINELMFWIEKKIGGGCSKTSK